MVSLPARISSKWAEGQPGLSAWRAGGVYQVPFADMQKAMDRLRGELPKDGWKMSPAPSSFPC